ncbi:MAG: glycosyltransferase family 2 protein [Terracidiphilus sp.]
MECGRSHSNETHSLPLRISVALCTYNGERYLREQLNSIASQTRVPYEVVICDDNSTDATLDIVESFVQSVSFRVRVEHNSFRLGSTHNFEKAIQSCTGDLIALCDQDDVWRPDKLSVQAARLESDSSIGGLFSDASLVDSESNSMGRTLWQSIDFRPDRQRQVQAGKTATVLLSQSVVTGATLMFRAELIPLVCPIPSSWVHDGWIAWIIALHSKLDLIQEPLSSYRIHSIQQYGVLPSIRMRICKRQKAAFSEYLDCVRQLQDLCSYLDKRWGAKFSFSMSFIRSKIRHLNMRANLPQNRLLRLLRVLPEVKNYREFSKGWKSLFKDVMIRC